MSKELFEQWKEDALLHGKNDFTDSDWHMARVGFHGAYRMLTGRSVSVPDDECFRALQDAFEIIQADANTEQNYESLCRIGGVLEDHGTERGVGSAGPEQGDHLDGTR